MLLHSKIKKIWSHGLMKRDEANMRTIKAIPAYFSIFIIIMTGIFYAEAIELRGTVEYNFHSDECTDNTVRQVGSLAHASLDLHAAKSTVCAHVSWVGLGLTAQQGLEEEIWRKYLVDNTTSPHLASTILSSVEALQGNHSTNADEEKYITTSASVESATNEAPPCLSSNLSIELVLHSALWTVLPTRVHWVGEVPTLSIFTIFMRRDKVMWSVQVQFVPARGFRLTFTSPSQTTETNFMPVALPTAAEEERRSDVHVLVWWEVQALDATTDLNYNLLFVTWVFDGEPSTDVVLVPRGQFGMGSTCVERLGVMSLEPSAPNSASWWESGVENMGLHMETEGVVLSSRLRYPYLRLAAIHNHSAPYQQATGSNTNTDTVTAVGLSLAQSLMQVRRLQLSLRAEVRVLSAALEVGEDTTLSLPLNSLIIDPWCPLCLSSGAYNATIVPHYDTHSGSGASSTLIIDSTYGPVLRYTAPLHQFGVGLAEFNISVPTHNTWAMVTIDVTPSNDIPSSLASNMTIRINQPTVVPLKAHDPEGDEIYFVVTSLPVNCALHVLASTAITNSRLVGSGERIRLTPFMLVPGAVLVAYCDTMAAVTLRRAMLPSRGDGFNFTAVDWSLLGSLGIDVGEGTHDHDDGSQLSSLSSHIKSGPLNRSTAAALALDQLKHAHVSFSVDSSPTDAYLDLLVYERRATLLHMHVAVAYDSAYSTIVVVEGHTLTYQRIQLRASVQTHIRVQPLAGNLEYSSEFAVSGTPVLMSPPVDNGGPESVGYVYPNQDVLVGNDSFVYVSTSPSFVYPLFYFNGSRRAGSGVSDFVPTDRVSLDVNVTVRNDSRHLHLAQGSLSAPLYAVNTNDPAHLKLALLAREVESNQELHVSPREISLVVEADMKSESSPSFSFGTKSMRHVELRGFSVQDDDDDVDAVVLVITTQGGKITLNWDANPTVYFTDAVLCRSLSRWQCRGDGYDDTYMVLVATPSDVQKAIDGMTYQSSISGFTDLVTVTIFDGVSATDAPASEFCLTDILLARARRRNVLVAESGSEANSERGHSGVPTALLHLGSLFDSGCHNSTVSVEVHVSALEGQDYLGGSAGHAGVLDDVASTIITWLCILMVLVGLMRCCLPCCRGACCTHKDPSTLASESDTDFSSSNTDSNDDSGADDCGYARSHGRKLGHDTHARRRSSDQHQHTTTMPPLRSRGSRRHRSRPLPPRYPPPPAPPPMPIPPPSHVECTGRKFSSAVPIATSTPTPAPTYMVTDIDSARPTDKTRPRRIVWHILSCLVRWICCVGDGHTQSGPSEEEEEEEEEGGCGCCCVLKSFVCTGPRWLLYVFGWVALSPLRCMNRLLCVACGCGGGCEGDQTKRKSKSRSRSKSRNQSGRTTDKRKAKSRSRRNSRVGRRGDVGSRV